MMKFLAGAVFMLAVCCLWMNTRLFPQQENFEGALMRCRQQKADIIAGANEDLLRVIGSFER